MRKCGEVTRIMYLRIVNRCFSFRRPTENRCTSVFLTNVQRRLFRAINPQGCVIVRTPGPINAHLVDMLCTYVRSSHATRVNLVSCYRPFLYNGPFHYAIHTSIVCCCGKECQLILLRAAGVSFRGFRSIMNCGCNCGIRSTFDF